MSGKERREALTNVSKKKICGGKEVYPGKYRCIWIGSASIAVLLALMLGYLFWPRGIIAVPGGLKAYGYQLAMGSMKLQGKQELEKGMQISGSYKWNQEMTAYYGLPITFQMEAPEFSGKEITLQIRTEHGNFLGDILQCPEKYLTSDWSNWRDSASLGQEFTIGNGETVYWENAEPDDPDTHIRFSDGVDVEAIVLADGRIVGYAVLEIWIKEKNSSAYSAKLVDAVYFPPINGHFQEITEDYVREQIAAARAWR